MTPPLDLVDRLREAPYRWGPPHHVATTGWQEEERERLRVFWPARYSWPVTGNILETIRDGFARLGVLASEPGSNEGTGVLMLGCEVDGERHTVALDFSDYHDFVNADALERSSLYLKCQFRVEGYEDPRIVPAGYTATGRDYYRYFLPYRLRGRRGRRYDVVGRFGFTFQGELRRKAVSLLEAAPDLAFVGAGGKVRYSRFLRESALARLCLHMPGNGPFTHRVIEFLGLGSCMLSARFATRLHVPLEPGVHYVEIAEDLSDLVDKARYYARHDEERERIAAAGADLFDRFLHAEQLALYYAVTMLERLGSSRPRRSLA